MKPERLDFRNRFQKKECERNLAGFAHTSPTPKSKKITQLKRKSELKVCAYTGLTRKKGINRNLRPMPFFN
ncbi:hypothetical protein EFL85_06040 [Pediococcus pentosaceus]|nr:hypothetical protein [Pediococcus pentosaceus]